MIFAVVVIAVGDVMSGGAIIMIAAAIIITKIVLHMTDSKSGAIRIMILIIASASTKN
jgi:hypothetical protein